MKRILVQVQGSNYVDVTEMFIKYRDSTLDIVINDLLHKGMRLFLTNSEEVISEIKQKLNLSISATRLIIIENDSNVYIARYIIDVETDGYCIVFKLKEFLI